MRSVWAERGDDVGHVVRHGLLQRVLSAPVALIAAPGGYGKSTLAAQVVRHAGLASATAVLTADADDATAAGLVVRALRRSGLTDVSAAASASDPAVMLDALISALARRQDRVVIVVDEVQRADESGQAWLADLAGNVPAGSHLVLAGRRIPTVLERTTNRGGVSRVGIEDLRFGAAEVAEVAGLDAAHPGVQQVLQLTDGWPAAVVLTVSGPRAGVGPLAAPDGPLLQALLDDLVGPPGTPDRDRLAALASLPLLSRAVADLVAGAGAFDLLVDSGIRLGRNERGWFTLPDSIAEALAVRGGVDEARARAAAAAYADAGDLSAAIGLLHQQGDLDGLAELLATRHWTELEALGPAELKVAMLMVGSERVGRWPVLVCSAIWAVEARDAPVRAEWLAVVQEMAASHADAVVRRACNAEVARAVVRQGDIDGALAAADRALEGIGPDELVTRARALLGAGHAHTIRCTRAALAEADACLAEAVAIFALLGERRWQAEALNRAGYNVSFQGGRIAVALEQLSAALALAPSADRTRANMLTFYTDVADSAGRVDEARAGAREAYEIALRLGDMPLLCLACWAHSTIAAHAGDVAETRRWIEQADRQGGPWLDGPHGFEFALAAADMFAMLGQEPDARRWMARSNELAARLAIPEAVAPVAARIEATFGDPSRAEAMLLELDGAAFVVQREHWVRLLLRAVAASRRGDESAARAHLEGALAEAELLGVRDLPARHEGYLLTRLSMLTDGAAEQLGSDGAMVRVRVLGEFAVTSGARALTPPPGHPADLVQLLALRGPVPAEEVIDVLWPDVDLGKGQARLRNLLNRLRAHSGDLVVRRGSALALADGVDVDAALFEQAAAAALGAPPDRRAGLARHALSLYTGELLVTHPFADWAGGHRERLRRRHLAVVDLLTAAATDAGDLDEALRLADIALAAEPYDQARHLAAARLLISQGRRVAARDLVERLRRQLAELEVELLPEVSGLLAQLSST